MAARKRTQEEKSLRTLRELASLPANKQCFDCHQRGPTYVNMLVGSFVCTSCSGMLRGLNPPHRVKSITMTVFTPEEVEFVKLRGNDYCRQVWLGTYDPRSLLEPESRDEQKIKDFMIQKYERKRWYVSPENVSFRSRQVTPPSAENCHSQQQHLPETKPLTNLLGKEATPLVLHSPPPQPAAVPAWASASNNNINHTTLNNNNNNNMYSRPGGVPAGKKALDLLSEFGTDPFAPPVPPSQQPQASSNPSPATAVPPASQGSYSSANGNFANFESAFSDSTTSSGSSGFTPEPTANPGFAVFQNNVVSSPPPFLNKVEKSKVEVPPSADRYAALADLDSLFHAQQEPLVSPSPPPAAAPAPSVISSAPTPAWGSAQVNTANNSALYTQPFNSPNPFATPTPETWNSLPQQNHTAQQQQQQVQQQGHIFNPFQQQQQQQQQQAFVSSLFSGNGENYGLGPQQAVFSPYGSSEMGQQFHHAMQNGGGAYGVWANAVPAGGGWMQAPPTKMMFPAMQPQANPFMTGAPVPKLNPSNPFL